MEVAKLYPTEVVVFFKVALSGRKLGGLAVDSDTTLGDVTAWLRDRLAASDRVSVTLVRGLERFYKAFV